MVIGQVFADDNPMEFHGYFRPGAGANSRGGSQVTFQAPGAPAKYRLGNENDNYGEFLFSKKLQEDATSAYFTPYYMLGETDAANSSGSYFTQQAYVEAGNFDFNKDLKFWAGKRYYMRNDIHINDYYFLNTSGYGGGFTDMAIGSIGKLAVAYLVGSDSDSAVGVGNPAKQLIDIRLYDVPAPAGKLTFILTPSTIRGQGKTYTNGDVYQSVSGIGGGIMHVTDNVFGKPGYNKLALLYGTGSSSWRGGGSVSPAIQSQAAADALKYFKDEETLEIAESGSADVSDHFSLMYDAIYKNDDNGQPASSKLTWTSAGIRPIYNFTKNFALVFEAGVDNVDNKTADYKGTLTKFTLAPTLRPNVKFFARPELRLFVTYAKWSNDFNKASAGGVGGDAFAGKTRGMTYGVQTEAWW
jgi:maltoporin